MFAIEFFSIVAPVFSISQDHSEIILIWCFGFQDMLFGSLILLEYYFGKPQNLQTYKRLYIHSSFRNVLLFKVRKEKKSPSSLLESVLRSTQICPAAINRSTQLSSHIRYFYDNWSVPCGFVLRFGVNIFLIYNTK